MSRGNLAVVTAYAAAQDAPAARAWAAGLGIPCTSIEEMAGVDLALVVDGGVLWLRDNRGRGLKPLSISFDTPEDPSKKQPLGQAVGRRTRTVVDATGGWGDDARRLCAMGCSVTVVERNPVMAALLRNAAARAARSLAGGRVPEIVARDAIEYLPAHPAGWDCVYLDPMFPPKRSSATLARRRLRLLRELAGDDPDRDRLFDAAMSAAARRVVVKRPDHSAPAFGEPAQTHAGKLVCYDVYFK